MTQTTDHRHLKRQRWMQQLFAYSFYTNEQASEKSSVLDSELRPIEQSLAEIDAIIQSFAPERPVKDINKVDLAILRLIVFESRQKQTPSKVLINEAVELAKEFGADNSPQFVNGVLGKVIKGI